MTKEREIRADVKYSNVLSTSGHETAILVSSVNGTAMTTSLQVALYFNKPHKDVLKAINSLECSDLFRRRNFSPSSYIHDLPNGGHKKEPMYYMTRDGFTFLAMGFTGKTAAHFKEAYIKAFDDMEDMLSRSEAIRYAERILEANVKLLNKRLAEAIDAIRKKHGMAYGPAGDLHCTLTYIKGFSFEDNIINLFNQIHNGYLDGYFFVGEAKSADRKIRDFKAKVKDYIEGRYGEECIYI